MPVEGILELEGNEDFSEHVSVVQSLGFDLFVKRARIGRAKHVRVRPIFRTWTAAGDFEVVDDQLTPDIIQRIVTLGGRLKGLGDWRPSSPTPGGFGTFTATVEEI